MNKKQKITMIRILLFLGTVISLYFVPWPIVRAWITPLPKTVQLQVDKTKGYGFDGIIVYVDEEGKQPAFYTAGYKNRETKESATPNTLFKIASVGKLYTAVAIAKLHYQGLISLDKSLAFYFPELKGRIQYADTITIKMLVSHRSGIPNFTATQNYWMNPKQNNSEKLDLILDLPANFIPDTSYEYCNTNYVLLSELIERVTNVSEFEYIKSEILKKLHLKNTFSSINQVNLNDVMSGYYVGYESDLKSVEVDGILTTAEDLAKFIRALNNGTIFTNNAEQEIYNSIYKYEHTGLIPGYQTIAKYHNDIDAVVIQFTNTVDFDGYNWTLSEIGYQRIIKILKRNHKL
ncbi:serine hydrolase [Lutibacter sp.]|uniref:serine hydrolase domain-containing protein n=1 Tax=Lutibacter sp. TaxID=1925666 RepID=UPI001A1FC236|nr:serine hydrolase domain-containing protein [Lutibacter sp.]MBI9041689.1 beta-lactamase family protein [Lutibacter sp.]